MNSIVVRAATEQDVAEITRIYGHYVLHSCATFEMEAPGREEMARRRAGVLELGLPYLAAEADGRVVGYAYANAYRTRAAYRFTVEDSIYIDPAEVGRGCGQALLAALIEQCEQGPWQQMVAVIGDSGNAASVGLHKRFGFREVGTLSSVGYKLGRWVDTVLMQRALGAAAMVSAAES
jgi:L-amino acid N-acyltransferase YncA